MAFIILRMHIRFRSAKYLLPRSVKMAFGLRRVKVIPPRRTSTPGPPKIESYNTHLIFNLLLTSDGYSYVQGVQEDAHTTPVYYARAILKLYAPIFISFHFTRRRKGVGVKVFLVFGGRHLPFKTKHKIPHYLLARNTSSAARFRFAFESRVVDPSWTPSWPPRTT